MSSERWMRSALELAQEAERCGEVPVGAVVVRRNIIIGKGFNQREMGCDPTAHAEILAIREAAQTIRSWRLNDCVLYVTLEPCVQCCGAIVLARIQHVVFGAKDPKAGAVCSLHQLLSDPRNNHTPSWEAGMLAEECGLLLSNFFKKLREVKK